MSKKCKYTQLNSAQQWGGIYPWSVIHSHHSQLSPFPCCNVFLYCLSLFVLVLSTCGMLHMYVLFSLSLLPLLLLPLLFVLDEKASPGAPEDDGKLSVGFDWLTLCRLLLCLSPFSSSCRRWRVFPTTLSPRCAISDPQPPFLRRKRRRLFSEAPFSCGMKKTNVVFHF